MFKAILQIIITVIAAFAVQQYLPFWSMAIVAGIAALLFSYKTSLTSFAAGFIACFLLWCAYSYTIDMENMEVLSAKLGELFKIEGSYLPYATGIIGGLIGGFGALTGNLLKNLFK